MTNVAYEHQAETNLDLEKHIKTDHKVMESFIYSDSSVETDCPYCKEMFQLENHFAQHMNQSQRYSFTCTHCKKHFPGKDM